VKIVVGDERYAALKVAIALALKTYVPGMWLDQATADVGVIVVDFLGRGARRRKVRKVRRR
jgi:hypothetical protein